MKISLPAYSKEYSVVSLALSEDAHTDLTEECSPHWFLNDDVLEIYPEQLSVPVDTNVRETLSQCSDYDAFEVFPDGTAVRCYDSTADDVVLYITGKCNSNCIMCPMAERIRRNSEDANIDHLIMIARQIPEDVSHITVTGGEPFLAGKDIFRLIGFCRSKFPHTEFLILTNGRALAIPEYRKQLIDTIPNNCVVGIPLHGATADIHDRITQTPGSFRQTVAALKYLQKSGIRIELRIVVSKFNHEDLPHIASLVRNEFPGVERVCIMAMEMTGAAFANRSCVWISYRDVSASVQHSVDILVDAGIDVRLYNFPLCTVSPAYWTICRKSISPEKIRYSDQCGTCRVNDACGGVFAGTFLLVKDELMPV